MPDALVVESWLRDARQRLAFADKATPELDARLLLQEVLGLTSSGLISKSRTVLTEQQFQAANDFLERRLSGEPVHRILGWREFYGRKFQLSDETLVPRPDTEVLVDAVLQEFKDKKGLVRILDIGTGSGAIAVTLAAELPNAEVVATDISYDALATAWRNAVCHKVNDRMKFLDSDVFANVEGSFDLIVSNPPYIPDHEIELLQKEVKLHDPRRALAGGQDGLEFYRRIFKEVGICCANHTQLYLEIGLGQQNDIKNLAESSGFEVVEAIPDLSSIIRVLHVRMS